jgi:hypothetical protein
MHEVLVIISTQHTIYLARTRVPYLEREEAVAYRDGSHRYTAHVNANNSLSCIIKLLHACAYSERAEADGPGRSGIPEAPVAGEPVPRTAQLWT